MNNLRARAFVPALLVHLFVFLIVSQHAFSQEAQTATPPAQPVATATAATEKVAAREEACEQSVAVAALSPASPEQTSGGKTTAAATQPLSFPSARSLKTAPAHHFSFAVDARPAPKLFDTSTLGAQQTSGTPYTPLTSEQKMRRAFKSAFLSPQAYALPLITGALTEAGEDDLPHKDTEDRVADALSRAAIRFGRRATNNLLGGGVYASLFRQDPRYERAEGKGVGGRVAHAVSRVFITRGDNGKLQPNYSRFAGQLSASAISNLWEQSTPGHDRIGADATFRRFGNSFITGALFNVINEFLPDIKKIFGK